MTFNQVAITFNFLKCNLVIFQVSPSHKPEKKTAASEEVSILRLVHFTHSPKIDFDSLKLGGTKKKILRILNPKDLTQEVMLISCLFFSDNAN